MRVANIFTPNSRNIGDILSGPSRYFKLPTDVYTSDFHSLEERYDHVILGGGGLLWSVPKIEEILKRTRGKVISWGLGNNSHQDTQLRWPSLMNQFASHGIRDWQDQFPWVPCASCMHPLFDELYPHTHDVVLYEHRSVRSGIRGIPCMRNSEMDFGRVIAFLGGADCVLTNSYHGAYWATLLNRRVIVINPFSSRFHHLRHKPTFADAQNWKDRAAFAQTFPDALDQCRAANRQYHLKVGELLAS